MKHILVIDIGGTKLKVSTAERRESLKIPSGKSMTAARMAAAVREAIEGWKYDAVSIGYPGSVKRGKPAHEPHNLSGGWMRFDFEKAFDAPVKIVNDAAMQALGAYAGGRMLFLGLGTGLGSALVAEGLLMPLELAHLPYRRGRTYEDYLGMRGFMRLGRRKWTRHVHAVVELLQAALQADDVVLGGGQTKKLKTLPPEFGSATIGARSAEACDCGTRPNMDDDGPSSAARTGSRASPASALVCSSLSVP